MSFLTAEKKGPRCPLPRARARGGGGKTYLGNARLKTFFCMYAFPKLEVSIETAKEVFPSKHFLSD